MKLHLDGTVENVYIYVADSLRYDAVDKQLSEYGRPIRTVASATNTCSSFPSIATGRYPPEHGVWNFSGVLPDGMITLFDLFPGDSPGFYLPNALHDSVGSAVHYGSLPDFYDHLGSLESPYFVLDRDTAPHLAYGYDSGDNEQRRLVEKYDSEFPVAFPEELETDFPSSGEYLEAFGEDDERLRQDYQRGAEMSIGRFESRLRNLRANGLLEDTLVIFTADHGEELGEYGRYSHGGSPVPETVYVPTVFYMENGAVDVSGEFMALVDLFPTIANLVGHDAPVELPGCDLVAGASDERLVFSAVRNRTGQRFESTDWSAWDLTGGGGTRSPTPACWVAC
jgi:arylsulfatase A-like enzyme